MRLATYDDGTGQRIGAVQGETLVDLSSVAPDMPTLIEGGVEMLERARQVVASADATAGVPLTSVTLLAPIPRPRKNLVCLGKNYTEHVAETARALGRTQKVPDSPIYFTKAVTAINHHNGDIPYNAAISSEIDWEVELAFIIGKPGKNISATEAMGYIFGYTILNDVTARDIQKEHRQFYRGKSLDGMAPVGPWIVTVDEIADPHNLALRLRVNGQTMQDGNTRDMLFKIPELIAVLSRGMSLEPGDIIATGTPAGVGMGMEPPVFLRPGDVVEAEVESIGVLRNRVVDETLT